MLDSAFSSTSNLPSLRQSSTRSQLSNQPSFLSRSKRSTSSLLSIGSDIQSNGSSNKNRRPFKIISYFRERRAIPTQDTFHHYQRVMRLHRAALSSMVDEKSQIVAAIKRERAHIDTLHKESEEKESSIRETLNILKTTALNRMNGKMDEPRKRTGKPPSIAQLKLLSNAILKEGLKFKRLSEQPTRIEREAIGSESLNLIEDMNPLELNKALTVTNDEIGDDNMDFQRSRLTNLVFKKEDAKLRLETIMSNRDMLTRVIFDHKTALEALKLKQKSLTEEAATLEQSFHEMLNDIAKQLGELTWKNAMVEACNDIAFLSKAT